MEKWHFIHCSDLHLGHNPDGVWNNRVLTSKSFDIFRTFLSDISSGEYDLVVVSGDISSYDTPGIFEEIVSVLGSVNSRFLLTGGNHDFISPDNENIFQKILSRYSSQSSLPYALIYKDILFCSMSITCSLSTSSDLIVPCGADSQSMVKDNEKVTIWSVPKGELSWLEETLKRFNNRLVIVNIHCPLLPVPERCRFVGFRDSGTLANSEEMMSILFSFTDKHFLILSGHMHVNYIVNCKNITQVVTCSLCEYPCEYREIIVNNKSIHISTMGLSNPKFAEESLIYGKEITRGTDQDREYFLSLK